MNSTSQHRTTVLPVDARNIGIVKALPNADDLLDSLHVEPDPKSSNAANLLLAAEQLKHSDIPVAFPTETVYGLGADATRSAAVQGIYKAKQRPADNPLIVHFASLRQLRDLLRSGDSRRSNGRGPSVGEGSVDPIPTIYHTLISRFWPGPLTIILPNPPNSPLAPEVTAGLTTFGARIPRDLIALALIQQADVPVAAPSANASTKPSPTAAEHVAYDLNGRIETIIDGGPCDVGVESTVVDGLCEPPLVLRPGGVSIEQLKECPGWERTEIGYKNLAEEGEKPKAPGMKYRHYSPKATVVLYEAGERIPTTGDLVKQGGSERGVGMITTRSWAVSAEAGVMGSKNDADSYFANGSHPNSPSGFAGMLATMNANPTPRANMTSHVLRHNGTSRRLLEVSLGATTSNIARGIFAALRELDREGVDVIFVEGIDEYEGEAAAAIMNRLRKAAEIKVGR